MLEENPGSLIRRNDIQEELRIIELKINNLSISSKSKVLNNRKVDDILPAQAMSSPSTSGIEISKNSHERISKLITYKSHLFIKC